MAAGRAVNTENIGLEKVGVKLTDRGFIQVDPTTLETSVKGVYAVGDVAGPSDACTQGYARRDARRGGDRGPQGQGDRLHQRAERHVLPSRGGKCGAHRRAGKAQGIDYQVGKFSVLGERARARDERDRGLRQDHSRARSTAR